MFTNLFFLILVLLAVNIAPETTSQYFTKSPMEAFLWGMGLYFVCLTLLFFQGKWLGKTGKRYHVLFIKIANVELLGFLFIFHFYFSAHRLFVVFFSGESPRFVISLFSILLYLIGLWIFHFASSRQTYLSSRRYEAGRQLRLLIPFVIPFIFFTLVLDLFQLIPNNGLQKILSGEGSWEGDLILSATTLFFVAITMVFLPFFIQWIWRCTTLEDPELRDRLEAICARAKFRHAGMKTWTIMNASLTAAIVGIIPRYRYVMFTKSLLRSLPVDEVEAILAHEIGHSKHHHLLIYPFVIWGMLISAAFFAPFLSEYLADFLIKSGLEYPSVAWESINPIIILIPYIFVMALYFRYIFGYFSRQFERQADLYPIQLGLDPQQIINALDQVAIAAGNTHRHPSWHHYSIQERIDFLEKAVQNPQLIERHHRKVKLSLGIYGILLAVATFSLFTKS